MVSYAELPVTSHQRSHWVDITRQVQECIDQQHIRNGLVMVSSLHTTAGLTINENADPDVERDFFWKINQLVSRDPGFRHVEGNSDSHCKASLVGFSVQAPLQGGSLKLGTWQSMYFCEFDGPRSRRVSVTILGDRD
jgi:secondary thiamine-phosphate synthase enzyme